MTATSLTFQAKECFLFQKGRDEEREIEKEAKEGKEKGNKKTRIPTKENQEYITH